MKTMAPFIYFYTLIYYPYMSVQGAKGLRSAIFVIISLFSILGASFAVNFKNACVLSRRCDITYAGTASKCRRSTSVLVGSKHCRHRSTSVLVGSKHCRHRSTSVLVGSKHCRHRSTVLVGSKHCQHRSTSVLIVQSTADTGVLLFW